MIQQALYQALQGWYDGAFSEQSFGFRPGRSAHDAVQRAREHVAAGHRWVVDVDLEKFFDRVNHDILMSRLARRIKDKRILLLIRRYLQAGSVSKPVRTQGLFREAIRMTWQSTSKGWRLRYWKRRFY